MKKINILYIIALGVLFVLFKMGGQYARQSVTFFGFAENKETQINMNHPVEVKTIHVIPGQQVKKGDLLLEVAHTDVDLKLDKVNFDLAELSAKERLWAADLRSKITQLEAQKLNKYNEIQAKIETIEMEIAFNRTLIKGLNSVTISEAELEDKNDPKKLRINQLQKELASVVVPLDVEIKRLKQELYTMGNPYKVQMEKLANDQKYYAAEQEKLDILAPTDGLIGNIHVKNAENLSSFSTLITFYEEKPTLVEGYVHESLILKVAIGDTIEVISSLHPEHVCRGKVVGLGSRIIEIPERLRKIAELKTFGREVLISIPEDNHFLQKEKVVLNVVTENTEKKGFLSLFN